MHFGGVQIAALVVFAVIAFVIVVVFVVVAASADEDVPYEEVQRPGYRFRKGWLAFLAALVPILVGISVLTTPYAHGSGAGRTLVKVTAHQFFFTFEPPRVPAGTRVRFAVTSKDVTHGAGLYDPHGELIGSVQAMPGYTNDLDLTLTAPGTYRVLCFEYCGLGHHNMQGSFTVTEG